MKTSDQQEVECDIYGTGQSYKIERCARVSQPAQDSANDIVTDNERNPQRADQQIMAGVAHGFGRSMHQCGYRIVEQGHEQGKKTSHQGKQPDGRTDDGRSFFVIACSGGDADKYRDACGQSQNDTGDSLHHLTADGDSGHACCVVILSHYEEVCASVKGLQHIGQQIGEGELKQYAGYISLCQIKFFHFSVCFVCF